MKRCPTCGNTYTNDKLMFCLEDGATLVGVSDSRASFDPEATLRISAEERPPSAEAFQPYAAPTIKSAPATTPYRQPPDTSGNRAPAAAPSSRSTSPVVIAGVTAIVVLLLVIAGIGIALLLRNSSSESSGNATAGNGNAVVNRDSSRNTAPNDNAATRTDNSSNRASANDANRSGSASMSASERAEAKVVRGTPLDSDDLTSLSREELRRLRNTVYARHGRTFDSADLQRYFDSRPWYKPRSDYNESDLTQTDRANIQLIQTMENR